MKKLIWLLLCVSAWAQTNTFPSLSHGTGAPVGACLANHLYQDDGTGFLYTCNVGAWVGVGGGSAISAPDQSVITMQAGVPTGDGLFTYDTVNKIIHYPGAFVATTTWPGSPLSPPGASLTTMGIDSDGTFKVCTGVGACAAPGGLTSFPDGTLTAPGFPAASHPELGLAVVVSKIAYTVTNVARTSNVVTLTLSTPNSALNWPANSSTINVSGLTTPNDVLNCAVCAVTAVSGSTPTSTITYTLNGGDIASTPVGAGAASIYEMRFDGYSQQFNRIVTSSNNPAQRGSIRAAHTDFYEWRNSANTDDCTGLGMVTGADEFQVGGQCAGYLGLYAPGYLRGDKQAAPANPGTAGGYKLWVDSTTNKLSCKYGTGGADCLPSATQVYYATSNGLVCDNATDDTAALNTLMATMNTAGGGTLVFPNGRTCRFSSAEITLPNNADNWTDGASFISSQAPIHWTCDAQNVNYQQLMSSGATLSQIQNACVLDLRFNATDAKLVSLGMGHWEVDHLAFVDTNTDCASFVWITNTIPDFHDNAFVGTTISSSPTYSCNDVFIMGGPGATGPGKVVGSWFQGYAGARIANNFFNSIKRATVLNNAAQTIMVFNNTVWSQAGCATCGAFEVAGTGVYGNTFSYNNIETTHYLYAFNITNSATGTMFLGNTTSDSLDFATLGVHTSGTDSGTVVLGGFSSISNMIGSSDTTTNALGTFTQWGTTVHWNGYFNLSHQTGAGSPGGTAATSTIFSNKNWFRPMLTKANLSTAYRIAVYDEIPNTQTSTASDTFVRANAATLGANWTAISGRTSLQILTNTAATQTTGAYQGNYYTNVTFPADQWAQCTLGTTVSNANNFVGCAVRTQSGADQWYAILMTTDGATFCGIRKMNAGTITTLQACSGTGFSSTFLPVAGDTLLITAVGNTITAFRNGIQLATTSDASYPTGSPGIVGFATSAASAIQYTGWSGGYMNCQPGVVTAANIGMSSATMTCTPSPTVAGVNMSTSTNAGTLLLSATAPTISTHFNTSSDSIIANGTASFSITVGTGVAGSTGALTLPTATTGWNCWLTNQTRADHIQQTGSTTTSATFTNFGTTFAATNWSNSDVLRGGCTAY